MRAIAEISGRRTLARRTRTRIEPHVEMLDSSRDPRPLDLFLMMVWFGIVAGLMELSLVLAQRAPRPDLAREPSYEPPFRVDDSHGQPHPFWSHWECPGPVFQTTAQASPCPLLSVRRRRTLGRPSLVRGMAARRCRGRHCLRGCGKERSLAQRTHPAMAPRDSRDDASDGWRPGTTGVPGFPVSEAGGESGLGAVAARCIRSVERSADRHGQRPRRQHESVR